MNIRKWVGLLAYYINTLLLKTLKVQYVIAPQYSKNTQYLCAFWHGKQWLPIVTLTLHHTKVAVLVSPSRDGDMLSALIEKYGYEVVRGSSRRKNVSALADMIRKLKEGYSLGLGVDGPIGPIYKAKPGLVQMAQKFDVDILPVGSAFSRKWVLTKAWDHYEIPKPFSKAVIYIAPPFRLDKNLSLEEANLLLETRIHAAEKEAKRIVNN